jgi:hypothetical protein
MCTTLANNNSKNKSKASIISIFKRSLQQFVEELLKNTVEIVIFIFNTIDEQLMF